MRWAHDMQYCDKFCNHLRGFSYSQVLDSVRLAPCREPSELPRFSGSRRNMWLQDCFRPVCLCLVSQAQTGGLDVLRTPRALAEEGNYGRSIPWYAPVSNLAVLAAAH